MLFFPVKNFQALALPMTIKNDRPNNHIPTTENEGWMELSADNGKPIEAQRIFYS